MKRLLEIMLCVTVLLSSVLFLSSCSTGKGVSDSQLRKDIENSEKIETCFRSDFTYDSTYEYISHKIIKRQTNINEKEDMVFCEITVENKYFNIVLETELKYIYYDQGGWILENMLITNTYPFAVAPPEKDLVTQFILNNSNDVGYICGEFETPSYSDGYPNFYGKNGSNNKYVKNRRMYLEEANVQFSDFVFDSDNQIALLSTMVSVGQIVNLQGDFRIFFDEKDGWSFIEITEKTYLPVFEINHRAFDYSYAEGSFKWKSYGKTYVSKISNVDTAGMTLQLDGDLCRLNPMRVNGLVSRMSSEYEFYYSITDDEWISSSEGYYRSYSRD